MPSLDPVVQDFEANTSRYVRNVVQAARDADRFGQQNSQAALAARQMGMAAQEAGERAARSQRAAAEAAQRLARGEETVQRATEAAVRAQRDMARAEIAQTRASNAAARAADEQGDQYRQLAREATLAAAAQRLAQLRAAGATREHDRLLTHLQGRFGDLGREGSGAFKLIGGQAKASGAALTSPTGGLAKVAVILGSLPWLSSAAASALTLGLGGALIGVGMAAAAGSARVKSEMERLKTHVKDTTKEISKPFERTWMVIADAARDTFDELVPDLKAAFAELAPAASAFADDFIRSFEEFKPAIRDVAAAAGPLLDTLGREMPGLMGRLADTISRVAKAADPAMFGRMIQGLGVLITHAGHAIAVLSDLAAVFYKFGPIAIAARNIDKVWGSLKQISTHGASAEDALDKLDRQLVSYDLGAASASSATYLMAAGMAGAGGQVGSLGWAMQLASNTAANLKAKLDELAGKTLTARAAARDYQQAVDDATKSVKENGRTLNINTQAGRNNQAALDNLVTKAHAQASAFRDSKRSAQDVAKSMADARRKFIETAIKMGSTRGEAVKLADKLYGVKRAADKIPPKKSVKVSAETAAAENQIRAFIQRINDILSAIGGLHLNFSGLATGGYIGYAGGGAVQGYPGGGMVRGAGSATSDSIPAWLSNGEFVVRAAETERWRPLLEAVNSGALSKVARLSAAKATAPNLARQSRTLAPAPAQQVAQVTHVHVHVAGHVTTERNLVEAVRVGLAGRSVNNGGNAGIAPGRRP